MFQNSQFLLPGIFFLAFLFLVSVSLEPLQDVSAHIVQVEMKSAMHGNLLYASVEACPSLHECNLSFPKILIPTSNAPSFSRALGIRRLPHYNIFTTTEHPSRWIRENHVYRDQKLLDQVKVQMKRSCLQLELLERA